MPQEFHVLRCFSCETFQVHIVKKCNKWVCKMCGEAQSLKKVYAKGAAKNCRLHVQALNEKRMLINENNESEENPTNEETESVQKQEILPILHLINSNKETSSTSKSKWSEFLTQKEEVSDSEEQIIIASKYSFEPTKRKRTSQEKQFLEKSMKRKVKYPSEQACRDIASMPEQLIDITDRSQPNENSSENSDCDVIVCPKNNVTQNCQNIKCNIFSQTVGDLDIVLEL